MSLSAEQLRGMHAATLVPMRSDFSIDEGALARHVGELSRIPGIRGLLVNGHAGENFVLTSAEKIRVVEIARDNAPPDCVICSGINAESSLLAAEDAKRAEAAGADVLLLFPPNSFALSHDPGAAVIHQQHVLAATRIPLLLYGAPIGAGSMAYDPQTLRALAADERVLGIKEGSWEVSAYEANLRLLESIRPGFAVMGSGDEHLLTAYIIGSHGSQVSLAAVAPRLCVDFYEAASKGDWSRARELHEFIYPLSVAIYRDSPGGRATARLKAALHLLGKLDTPVVRPPQPAVTDSELRSVKVALMAANLLAS